MNSLFFSENGYSNHICFNVSVRFNNLIAEQSPNRISEDQTKKLEFILSLHKQGLGYRRIAKVLNEERYANSQRVCMGRKLCLCNSQKIQRKIRERRA